MGGSDDLTSKIIQRDFNSDFHSFRDFIIMLILSFFLDFLSALRNPNPTYGKITFVNGLNQMVRVQLSPSLTWTYFERRSNQTLRTNPKRQ